MCTSGSVRDVVLYTVCSLCAAGLPPLGVTVDTSPRPNVIISWPHPAYGECLCVTYALRINGVDQTNDIPCDQTSVEIESGKQLHRAHNNVSVIPRSAHPSIGLLEDLSDHTEFIYRSISKSIPLIINITPCTTVSHRFCLVETGVECVLYG